MLSLVIVTALYVLVAAVAVGARNWQRFDDSEAALAQIMKDVTGQTFWGTCSPPARSSPSPASS